MTSTFKKNWKEFKSSRPGHRFRDRYERRQKQAGKGFNWHRFLNVGGGVIVVLLGLVLMPAPGPGGLVAVVGLALLGSEFLGLAKFLDWAEVKGRRMIKRILSWWRRAGALQRTSVIATVCMLAAGAAFAGWALWKAS